MADADLYSIYMADEPTAEEYAAELARAIRGKRSAAMLGSLGSPALQKYGAQQAQFAMKDQAELGDAGKARLTERRMGLQQAAQQRNFEAQRRLQEQEQAAQARNWQDQRRLQEQQIGVHQQLADQGNWAPLEHLGLMVNRRTGQTRPLGGVYQPPGGAGSGSRQHAILLERLGKALAEIQTFPRDLDVLERGTGPASRPGAGPVEGRVPEWGLGITSPQQEEFARQLRQAAGAVFNAKLYLQSGKALSPGEAERKAEEIGIGKTQSQGAFNAGVPRIRQELRMSLRNMLGRYPPEVVKAAEEQGLLEPFVDILKDPGSVPAVSHTPGGGEQRKQVRGEWYTKRDGEWYKE